jgi:hypothetical protein
MLPASALFALGTVVKGYKESLFMFSSSQDCSGSSRLAAASGS